MRACPQDRTARTCEHRDVATLLIVDDSATFRGAARALLEAQGWTVVGEASDGAVALRAVVELEPDVVLLDVLLPDADGFDVAESIAELPRPPRIVMCSTHAPQTFGRRLADSRAAGFLPKSEISDAGLTGILG
jgi:DNA-binding NarL/FixJ family response regulator